MKNFINFLPPWVETNIQPAFYDKESGSVLQQTARMYAKVNQLIRHFNDLSKETKETVDEYIGIVNEYIEKFVELKDYVDDYFENLDVQEEIDHKLDEMLADGVFQDIVDAYLDSLTGIVKYIFPKNWNGLSGDASLIKAYGKTILIDTYRASNKAELYQMLSDYDVDHIDYLILTHYHDDHIGNVENLINDGYVDSESYIYLPANCQQITDDPELTAYRNAILLAIAQNNIPSGVPLENSKLVINDNFYIEFYNTDSDVLSTFTNYNNCSTLCMVHHGATTSYFTGDALGSAQGRALTNGFITGHVDLYKVEHHGIQGDNTTIKVQETILPDYVYQSAFIGGLKQGIYDKSTALAYLTQKGSRVYASYLNQDYIVFGSTTNNMWVEQGKQSKAVSNNNAVGNYVYTIYVDANNNSNYQDGMSWDTAFNDIGRGIAHAGKMNVGAINIVLAEGEYGLTPVTGGGDILESQANGLDIVISKSGSASVDQVKLKGKLDFRNCNVEIKNVTFENDATITACISANHCKLYVHNCVMDGTNATDPTFIWCQECDVRLNTNTISNYNLIVSGHVNDAINLYDNTISDVATLTYCRGGVVNNISNTLTNVTNISGLSDGGYDLNKSGKIIYSGAATSGTINFTNAINSYNRIVVISGAVSAGTLGTYEAYSYYPSANFAKSGTYPIRTNDGYYDMTISADGLSATLTAHGTSLGIRTIIAFKEPLLS